MQWCTSPLPLHTAAGNACDDLLRQKDIQDKGRQKHDNHRREHPGPVPRILHGVDHRVQSNRNRPQLIRVGKDQGNKILIPNIDKIKNRYCDDPRLGHGKHDKPERLCRRAPVNGRGLLKGPGQIAEKRHKENRRVRHIDADVQKDQQHRVAHHIVEDPHAGHNAEQRQHDHNHRNAHSRHKSCLDQLVARKDKPGQNISRRSADDDQKAAGDDGIDQRISENPRHIRIDPGLHIILKMKPRSQKLIRKNLLGGGKAG